MSQPIRPFNTKEVVDLFESLPRVRLGEDYTEDDRARDFISVLTTESGQRVLAQIADLCSPAPSPLDAEKHGKLAFKEGQRWVLGMLMRCFLSGRKEPEKEERPDGKRRGRVARD